MMHAAAPAEDVLELTDIVEPEREAFTLVSEPTVETATAAFQQLTDTYGMTKGLPMGAAHKTLEELTKELLRPMLKTWLDKNLSNLVERMVEREISKIAGRADD